MRQVLAQRQSEAHVIRPYLVETLVIHRCQELCLCWLSVRCNGRESPLLFLSWCETVAECCPLKCEILLRHRSRYCLIVGVSSTVLHPCVVEQHTRAILLFIFKLSGVDGLVEFHSTALKHLVARNDGIKHMNILVRRTYHHAHGLAVAREHIISNIEPVVCLHARSLVVE